MAIDNLHKPNGLGEDESFANRKTALSDRFSKESGGFGGFTSVIPLDIEAIPTISEIETQEVAKRLGAATVRFQFEHGQTFDTAASAAPFFRELGIGTLYLAPIQTADMDHGYSISDPTTIDPRLGGEAGFEKLVDAARKNNLKIMVDAVPNHMSARAESNPWWADVLEHGSESVHWNTFDMRPQSDGKFVIPRLGDHLENLWEDKEQQLGVALREDGSFVLQYWENTFPLDPTTYLHILGDYTGPSEPLQEAMRQIQSLITLPDAQTDEQKGSRLVQTQAIKALIQDASQDPDTKQYMQSQLETFQKDHAGGEDNTSRKDKFLSLMDQQRYTLAHWQTPGGYRQFFDIKELVTLRSEDPNVLMATQGKLVDLFKKYPDVMVGIRFDHIDGLRRPHEAIATLRETIMAETGKTPYFVVEKIQGPGETLSKQWPVHGETGYVTLTKMNNLLTDWDGVADLRTLADTFTETNLDINALASDRKRETLRQTLAADVSYLTTRLEKLAEQTPLTSEQLYTALLEVTTALPSYRSYITNTETVSQQDLDRLVHAFATAQPHIDPEAFTFLSDVLLLHTDDPQQKNEWHLFVEEWQQLTGPAMAKGFEDSVMYRMIALRSTMEVGSSLDFPQNSQDAITAFHRQNEQIVAETPLTLVTDATHDTKLGADTRAMMAVISEQPDIFATQLAVWEQSMEAAMLDAHQTDFPDVHDRYVLYQILATQLPLERSSIDEPFTKRMHAYMEKSMRESGRHTSWGNQNWQYEQTVHRYIDTLLQSEDFFDTFLPYRRVIDHYGQLNSFGQVVLKTTVPGVPDIYQSAIGMSNDLVDPDNRRAVDFERLEAIYEDIETQIKNIGLANTAQHVLTDPTGEQAKVFILSQSLAMRQSHPEAMLGEYLPLHPAVNSPRETNVVAFARTNKDGSDTVITAVPRLTTHLAHTALPIGAQVWEDDALDVSAVVTDGTSWRNIFTGEVIEAQDGKLLLASVFQTFPVAVFEKLA